MMEYKEYPRLIIFEMHVLPEYAFALDMLSDTDTFTGISEKCSEWFWRFSICVGMPKLSASTDVINNSIEALKVIQNPSDKMVNRIKQVFTNFAPNEIIESWQESLGIMVAIANNRKECQWVAPLYPIDKAFTQNPTDILEKMASNFELAVNKITKNKK